MEANKKPPFGDLMFDSTSLRMIHPSRYLSSVILAVGILFILPASVHAAQQYYQGDISTLLSTGNTSGSNAMFQATETSQLTTIQRYLKKTTGGSGNAGFLISQCTTGSATTCPAVDWNSSSVSVSVSGAGLYTYDYTSQNLTLTSGKWYRVQYFAAPSGGLDFYGASSPNMQNGGFYSGSDAMLVCDSTAGACPFVDTTTHIQTTTPADNATIATSTTATVGATGYVNPADYSSGMYLEIKYAAFSAYQASIANPDTLFTTITFPITSSGAFAFSSSTPILTAGQYKMISSIKQASFLNNVLNFIGFGQFANNGIAYSKSTTFTAAHLSGYDVYVASTTALIDNYVASSSISLSTCTSWTSFSLGDCLNLLFVPQTQPIATALDNFKNNFLTYAPWGYLTRFIVIMSGTATTTLPTLSVPVTLGDGTTDTMTFNMQEFFTTGQNTLDSITDGNGHNERDIFEPIIDLFIALSLIILIVQDLTRMPRGHSRE